MHRLQTKGPRSIKFVVIGDGLVGKTCLLYSYLTRRFQDPDEYKITIFERYFEDITVDDEHYQMAIWDLVSNTDFDKVRVVSYAGAECAVICYAVNNRDSLKEAITYWLPEVQKTCPNISIILVATKIDLRDQDLSCISHKEGKKAKKQIGAIAYVECSARLGLGLSDLKNAFSKAIRLLPKEDKCKVS